MQWKNIIRDEVFFSHNIHMDAYINVHTHISSDAHLSNTIPLNFIASSIKLQIV